MSLETFGRYQLLKKIAMGGMAQIYLARQVGLEGFEKLLVVKRILPHLAENQDFISMFLDEARIAARLNHPNVVQIFDLGAQDDSYFIAMEYIHGEDVRRVWRHADKSGKPLPIPLICRIIIDTCAGLDYAHKRTDAQGRPLNIVHRDISPQNILVSFDGNTKVVDFGIAKAADKATVTRSGVLKGKYSYMSPEQAAGGDIDHRTDVFALGVVMHELLTGMRLFKRGSDVQTLQAVAACEVPPPSEGNADIPPELDAIVLKALKKDRKDRWADAREFGAAIEDWLLANKLPSSNATLGAMMHELYADRLRLEAEEGKLLAIATANEASEPERATPDQRDGKDSKDSKDGKDKNAKSLRQHSGPISKPPGLDAIVSKGKQTNVDRPGGKSGAHAKSKRIDEAVKAAVAAEAEATERTLPTQQTQPEATPRASRRWPLVVAALLVVGGVAAWLATRPSHPVGTASVTLTTTPPGASVTFEGNTLSDVTPVKLPPLAKGAYVVTIVKDGYEALEASVTVPASGELAVPFVLRPAAVVDAGPQLPVRVSVRFESEPPGASLVFPDGARLTAPATIERNVGDSVSVRVELDGFVSVSDSFQVRDGDAPHLYALKPGKRGTKLKLPTVVPEAKSPGKVRFIVKPWATVDCGAYHFGQTPFEDQTVPAGDYQCSFTNPDFGKKTKLVHVEANAVTKVAVTFE